LRHRGFLRGGTGARWPAGVVLPPTFWMLKKSKKKFEIFLSKKC
jgi:hypothetical protein